MDYNTYLENMQLNSIQEEYEADKLNFLLYEAVQFRSLEYIKEDTNVILEGKILNLIKDFFRNLFELIKAFFAKIFEFIKDIFDRIKYKLFEKFPRDLESKFDAVIKKIRNESYIDNTGDVDYIFESESNNIDLDYVFESGNMSTRGRVLFDKAMMVLHEYYNKNWGNTEAKRLQDKAISMGKFNDEFITDEEHVVGDIEWYPQLWKNLEEVVKIVNENAITFGTYITNGTDIDFSQINKEYVYNCISGYEGRPYKECGIDIPGYIFDNGGVSREKYGTSEVDGNSSRCIIVDIIDSGLFKKIHPVHIYGIANCIQYRREITDAAFDIDKWKADAKYQYNITRITLEKMQKDVEFKSKMIDDSTGTTNIINLSGIKKGINLAISCVNDYTKNIEQAYVYMNKQASKIVFKIISVAELLANKFEDYSAKKLMELN